MIGSESTAGRWTLEDLIPNTDEASLEHAFAALEAAVVGVEDWKERLTPHLTQREFAALMENLERVAYAGQRLNGYAILWTSEQTSDERALTFRQRVDSAVADARNRTLFFDLWWKTLDPVNAERLMSTCGDVRYYLETLRRFAPFTLSEPEEKVINLKDVNGPQGMLTLYEMIANGFTYALTLDGETKSLTRTELMVYARDADPAKRKAAYDELYRVFIDQRRVLGQLFKYIAADWRQEHVNLRGMASPISARNLRNDLSDDAVDLLLASVRRNVGLFQRFFRMKARWLGMDALRRVDIYAPLESTKHEFPFPAGVELVLDTVRGFSPRLGELAERVMAQRHLDALPRRGKDTGAFCFGVLPDVTPWVLVNYNNRADDVATLGHELGHAMHSMMAGEHSVLTFHSALPMAETASNFVEVLLLHRMLDENPDPAFRRYLLAKFIDDSYVSVVRQAFFVLYEQKAYEMIQGRGATIDELAACYMGTLEEQFGESVKLSEAFRWEWLTIPHLYATPFYCYAYAFGMLLVLALYQQYVADPDGFRPRYLKILAYGGSKPPLEILDEAGFDVRDAGFWQGGFDILRGMIDELEALQD